MKKWFKKREWYRPEYHKADKIVNFIAFIISVIMCGFLIIVAYTNIVFSAILVLNIINLWLIILFICLAISFTLTYVDKHEKKIVEK